MELGPSHESSDPLFEATVHGKTEEVAKLLKEGAHPDNPESVRKHNAHAVIVAAGTGKHDILALLLHAGADANQRDPASNYSALFYAVKKGDIWSARLLLAGGADVNLTDEGKHLRLPETPLTHALFHGKDDMVDLLLLHGAKMDRNTFNNLKTMYFGLRASPETLLKVQEIGVY